MAVKAGVAKQALGFVEEKLRRVFNLAGPIDADLDSIVKPVIIVDDLRDPGHAFFQGRSYAYSTAEQPAGVAGTWFVKVIQFRSDVTVETVYHFGVIPANASYAIQVGGADEALPIGGVTFQCGSWRDRKAGTTDFPPIVQNSGLTAGTVALNSTIFVAGAGGTALTMSQVLPLKVMIPANGWLMFAFQTWGVAVSTAFNFGFYARVWPQ
jgi:hypothetical protein